MKLTSHIQRLTLGVLTMLSPSLLVAMPNVISTNYVLTPGTDSVAAGGTLIETATTPNLIVSSGAGPTTVNYGVSGSSGLFIRTVTSTDTVTFNLTQDLAFNGNTTEPMLVYIEGPGQVIFSLTPGADVAFTAAGAAPNRGTWVMVAMDTLSPQQPKLVFDLNGNAGVTNTFVTVGRDSWVSYSAAIGDTTGQAIIQFNPTEANGQLGRLIFRINNGGAVTVLGQAADIVDVPISNPFVAPFNYTNFFPAIISGGRAFFEVLNNAPGGAAYAGLLIENNNATLPLLRSNPFCEVGLIFSSPQPGFIVGENGTLQVDDDAYVDYVGTAENVTPTPTIPAAILDGRQVVQVIKDRNPSALFVDNSDPSYYQSGSTIFDMQGARSAIYFRSARSSSNPPVLAGAVATGNEYLVEAADQYTGNLGYGSIVFDVEGPLTVAGTAPLSEHVLNVLSLQVTPSGGSVFIESTNTNFPLRTFNTAGDGTYLQYGKAAFMVNNRMEYDGAALQHTDSIHAVFEKNFPNQSEATYTGGESWLLCPDARLGLRPSMVFINSQLLINTDAAFTGVDIRTTNPGTLDDSNDSHTVFYHNGYCIDQGTGRQLILGTDIGALASDLGTVINRDAHFDVMQEVDAPEGSANVIMRLLTAPNNGKVTEGLPLVAPNPNPIATQYSMHDIFLGFASNITVGNLDGLVFVPSLGEEVAVTDRMILYVDGSFIGFDTQGGRIEKPELGATSGEGAIFVDTNGVFEIAASRRVAIATMISTSATLATEDQFPGLVDIPEGRALFARGVGIQTWNLDLSVPAQRVLVAPGEVRTDITIDWEHTVKDTCVGGDFIPYNPPAVPPAFAAPAVTTANISSIPVIQGFLDQLQILNGRLGDLPHVMVDGGYVGEVILFNGDIVQTTDASANAFAGVAPVLNLVVQNNARVGLGSAHRNLDSNQANLILGINGVTIIANGDAQIVLNEDASVENILSIIPGPDFVENGGRLYITSPVERELRIKQGAFLDLSMFTEDTQMVQIGGSIHLVFEPGSRLLMNGGIFQFSDDSVVTFEPYNVIGAPVGTSVASTDAFRVKWSGTGLVNMTERAQMIINRDAYVGIESVGTVTIPNNGVVETTPIVIILGDNSTNYEFNLVDDAQIQIGTEISFGGSLQIGNTLDVSGGAGEDLVSFTLTMGGLGTQFVIGNQGFFGVGVGIVDKPAGAIGTWRVGGLYNLGAVALNIGQGTFVHDQSYPSDNIESSLFAISDSALSSNATPFSGVFTNRSSLIKGGGNFLQLTAAGLAAPFVVPAITTEEVGGGTYNASIFASRDMIRDRSVAPALPVSAEDLFFYLKVPDQTSDVDAPNKYATIFLNTLNNETITFVANPFPGVIQRKENVSIFGADGQAVNPLSSLDSGIVGLIAAAFNQGAVIPTEILS